MIRPRTNLTMPGQEQRVEEFMQLFAGCERRLYDYVFVLVGNMTDADEILQDTALLLWRHFDKFEPGTDFDAWARTVAYHQVMDFYRHAKPALQHFSAQFLESVAAEVAEHSEELETRQHALESCLQKLSVQDRDLVMRCYGSTIPMKQIATSIGRTLTATYQLLWRIRAKLTRCVEYRLRQESS
jgi:RNA polymerase sigma-70 factor, ECF subfamily